MSGRFLLVFLPGVCLAPGLFCLRCVFIYLSCIKSFKTKLIQFTNSQHFDSSRKIDEILKVFLPKLQEPDLLLQCFASIKIQIIQNLFDILQRELKFLEKQDHLQSLQCLIVIKPVARSCDFRGRQKTNLVVMMQGA